MHAGNYWSTTGKNEACYNLSKQRRCALALLTMGAQGEIYFIALFLRTQTQREKQVAAKSASIS